MEAKIEILKASTLGTRGFFFLQKNMHKPNFTL